jgi:hypothetical protein
MHGTENLKFVITVYTFNFCGISRDNRVIEMLQ